VRSSEAFEDGKRDASANFFTGKPSSKQNQQDSTLSLPTSKAIGN
jgi:hypothetical protein